MNENARRLLNILLEEGNTVTFGQHPDATIGGLPYADENPFGLAYLVTSNDFDAIICIETYSMNREGELTQPVEIQVPLSLLKAIIDRWGYCLKTTRKNREED